MLNIELFEQFPWATFRHQTEEKIKEDGYNVVFVLKQKN